MAHDNPPDLPYLPDEIANEVFDAFQRREPTSELIDGLCDRYPAHARAIRAYAAYERDGSVPDTRPADSVLEEIADRADRRPDVRLREVDAELEPFSTNPNDESTTVGKYLVGGPIGRGGVGEVLRARDQDLNRDVALKFLREDHHDKPGIVRRFVEEAQIGGQLQHPGIVPVYDLGLADGRPFFAMKLIKGKTLADLLAQRSDPSDDRHRFLQIFLQVCQTVAFAHVRGVVHRDLKPQNIMVGRFGEVQVVDWGLGKVLDRADEPVVHEGSALSAIDTVRKGDTGSESVPGSVMGTPAYMPPEQAIGDVEKIGPHSDVFGLGAILCEILTGHPPYVVATADSAERQRELMLMAARAKLDDARGRLRGCGAEGELVELCLECLSPSPDVRPLDADAVGSRVADHLSGVEARAEAARVEIAIAGQRQRLMKAIVTVVGLAFFGMGWLWYLADEARAVADERAYEIDQKNQELAQEKSEVERKNEQISDQHGQIRETALKLQRKIEEFNLISLAVLVEDARKAAQRLTPAWPANVKALEAWMSDYAEPIEDGWPVVRRYVSLTYQMRQAVAPLPGFLLVEQETRAAPFMWTPLPEPEEHDRARQFAERVGELTERYMPRILKRLSDDLDEFIEEDVARVRAQLEWAQQVEDVTIERFRGEWEEARTAVAKADGVVASELYRDHPIDLRPQMGLVPIGMNPKTKLWEFYHMRSAWNPRSGSEPGSITIPTVQDYDDEGRVPVFEETGIVFVLIPGGSLTSGASPKGQGKEVVAPFFLARHELTQGQWLRLQGDNPSYYAPGVEVDGMDAPVTLAHPVEFVGWDMCSQMAENHGLLVPTGEQWEYACRAGTTSPWSSGPDLLNLQAHANIYDQLAKRHTSLENEVVDWDDGFIIHAPVGSLLPNPFGLLDMHGNVAEWCSDVGTVTRNAGRAKDKDPGFAHFYRGGSFDMGPDEATSAAQLVTTIETAHLNLGVRLSRRIRE